MKYLRMLIFLIVVLVLALAVQLLVYKDSFTYAHMSNALFTVGIILFLPSFVAITHAYEVLRGINYVMRVFFSPSYRAHYPHFKDYKDSLGERTKSTVYIELLIVTFIVLVASYILASLAV